MTEEDYWLLHEELQREFKKMDQRKRALKNALKVLWGKEPMPRKPNGEAAGK